MELLTSEIYGPRGAHIRYIDVGGYRHNYKGFHEKSVRSNLY